ncbi:hypothetical protein [Acinetobacter sp. ANC 4648]|uniref:hypothetical protein n=1 Tax=Acinetobacter sp. ANC 4648 TaxID=1977875 RepID=UPI000A3575BA|nr:hypothetical protein [Acinetobacter sp. ANC 4648]OTG82949.1 hypothetical protein B9T27_06675 [Acinetobacter sp. ANC 4648]
MSFQLIQLEKNQVNVTCPYCQQDVLDWSQEQYIQPCAHTLFIAMDLGFEYISDAYEASMQRTVDEIHAHDDESMNIWHEISQASFPDYVIYQADLGVEGMYRYIGLTATAMS